MIRSDSPEMSEIDISPKCPYLSKPYPWGQMRFLIVNSVFRYVIVLVMGSWCCSPTVQAQIITISEELPMRNDYAYTMLGWMDNDLMLFRDKGHEYFVQALDAQMQLKWEREIFLGDRKADIIGVVGDTGIFHVVYGMRDRGDYHLLHRIYNRDLNIVDSVVIERIENVFITPRIRIVVSEDKTKVLLFQEDHSGLNLVSYDLKRSQLVWKKEIKLAGAGVSRDFRSMLVTNAGEMFLVLEPEKFLQKVQSLDVYFASGMEGDVVVETIDLGDVQVYDYQSVFDNMNRKLIITGMYSDRNISRAQGFYFIRFDLSGTYQVSLLPFDESLLAEVHGREVPLNKGLSDFNVQEIALRQDGGAVIVAELNKEFSRRSSLPLRRDNGSFTRGGWVDYYYEDLVLVSVHPDGTEHWKKVLRKRQYSQDDNAMYSSFFLFKSPSRLRFLFNDEIKQENTVGGYDVTGTGFIERKTVFNTDYQRLKLRFKDGLQVAYNECIVPSERNNRLNLVRIQFKD